MKRRVVWECACGEMTTRTHYRQGANGAMFHAGPDAPPSDHSPTIDARVAYCGVCREHPCLCDPTQTSIVIRHGDGTETLVRIFGQHVPAVDVTIDVKPVEQRSWSPASRDTWELRCE